VPDRVNATVMVQVMLPRKAILAVENYSSEARSVNARGVLETSDKLREAAETLSKNLGIAAVTVLAYALGP
jgi:hypothetical protein